MNELTTKIQEIAVESVAPEKVASLHAIFKGEEDARTALDEHYNDAMSFDVITKKTARQARELRLKIVKYRTALEKKRKSGKLEHTRAIRAIDSIAKLLLLGIGDKEEKLKEIEEYPEQQERLRVETLTAERQGVLDIIYSKSAGLSDTIDTSDAPVVLGEMSTDDWEQYKKQQEDNVANIIKIAELEAQLAQAQLDARLAQAQKESAENEQEPVPTPPPIDMPTVSVPATLNSGVVEDWESELPEINVVESPSVVPPVAPAPVPVASQATMVDAYKKATDPSPLPKSDSERLRAFAILLHKVGKENTPLVLQDKALQDKLDGWLFSFAGMLKALAEMGDV